MKPVLYVALPAEAGAPLQVVEERGDRMELLGHNGPFPSGFTCTAFAPATMVAHFQLPVPGRNEAEATRTALYAVEDELAEPIEEVHLALGPRTADGANRNIYVVSRNVMTAWLEQLSKAGLDPERIIPEQCLFDTAEHGEELGDHTLLSIGPRLLAADASLPADAQRALGINHPASAPQSGQHLIRLAERAATRQTVNLRSGVFARARKQPAGYRAWRVAAGMAIAATSIWTGNVILETRNYNYATRQLERQASERYAALFPGAAIPADIDRASREMLASQTGPTNFSFQDAANYLYEATAAAPGLRITALSYDGDQQLASATFVAPQPDALERARAFLETEGLMVGITLDPPADGPITGTLKIEAQQ